MYHAGGVLVPSPIICECVGELAENLCFPFRFNTLLQRSVETHVKTGAMVLMCCHFCPRLSLFFFLMLIYFLFLIVINWD